MNVSKDFEELFAFFNARQVKGLAPGSLHSQDLSGSEVPQPTGRDVAREERFKEDEGRSRGQQGGIRRRDLEEKRLDEPGGAQREENSGHGTGQADPEALAYRQPPDVPPLSAQSNSYA